VQNESTPSSSSEEELVVFPMITHLMCQWKDLKGKEGNGLKISGMLLRRWRVPPLHFWRNPKILKKQYM
jgi:hypothetical protein